MTAIKIVKMCGAILGLTGVHIIAVSVSGLIFGVADPSAGSDAASTDAADQASAVGLLALMCLLNVLILIGLAKASIVRGLKLSGWLFILYFMVAPVMSLMEAVFFDIGTDASTALTLILMQGVSIAVVVSFVPLLTGHLTHSDVDPKASVPLYTSTHSLSMKGRLQYFMMGSILYLVIYWMFGYYVAWQSPEVRAFYGADSLLPFFDHLEMTLREGPGLLAFQLLRGLVWMGLAFLIVRKINTPRLMSSILVGATFALLMGTGLIMPNPYMPEAVRMVHLVEVLSSNFLYGFLVSWLWLSKSVVKEGATRTEAVSS
ncbi:hypothetical protein QGN29_06655 [Temperatibacter marinus]|uniref:Uncharacterized protein n=1 Tax=Temperatibacter marinus TaxID=1456591 RepID=A0AA52EJ10_9PROT|nr:hypothetical protein [Temperatibacter marinus]WND04053.1 hypothetical protein QGN29_06655 [Temperatibacter marinus]